MTTTTTMTMTMTIDLWSLFGSSFLAATFLPFASEVHLAYLAKCQNLYILLLVATVGNTLGGLTNFGLGYLAKIEWAHRYLRIKENDILKAKALVHRFGLILAFFTFLPVVGDPIAFVLGLNRERIIPVTLLMSAGKLLRYAFILFVIA